MGNRENKEILAFTDFGILQPSQIQQKDIYCLVENIIGRALTRFVDNKKLCRVYASTFIRIRFVSGDLSKRYLQPEFIFVYREYQYADDIFCEFSFPSEIEELCDDIE